jgi:prepilin-type processing-associated H-X9-DG protein
VYWSKVSDVVNPGPANQFAFLDENPNNIILTELILDSYLYRFDSLPASCHNGSSAISFVDGHVETHRWRDARTMLPLDPIWTDRQDGNTFWGTHTDEQDSPDPLWLHSKSAPSIAGL